MDSKKLRHVLAQEDAVLFIGAGVSIWSGLPSWSRLVQELAEFLESEGLRPDSVRAESQRGDLLQAASLGFDLLTKPQIGDFIRKACRHGTAKPHEIHRKIVSLGPRCFITTNYDNLIEESLRLWKPDRFVRGPFTNRHLTEIADIVHARSTDFVFKPHGDAMDVESIILTREQYRALLPGGERNAAFESLKMLMATRPIVYLGFSLRDPNFFFLRDLIANTFKGSARDHYAIMPDTTDDDERFWRRNYGIHLVPYRTIERADKSRDHAPLLALLDELSTAAPALLPSDPHPALAAEEVLRLARYAAGLTRYQRVDREFPLRVYTYSAHSSTPSFPGSHRYEGKLIKSFLIDGPRRAALIGPPGAGKTYALRQAVASLAETLHDICLAEMFNAKDVVVPIYVDLKLYNGNLYNQMESTLPPKLPLSGLARSFKLKLFVDSFNELPREHWESGVYEADFLDAITKLNPASVTIGSRSIDGFANLAFPAYGLDEIDEEFVSETLGRLGIDLEGRFRNDAVRLLQKPFYFNLVTSRGVVLSKEPHPRDLFRAVFDDLSARFRARFGTTFDLTSALSLAAYEAIDRGEEAQALADILDILATALQKSVGQHVNASDVANWLVSSDILVPSPNSRVSFFHQSATEYLAACELARRFVADRRVVGRKLRLTRWDQAIFLALSLLSASDANPFIEAVIESDFLLALNASKYMEHGRDEVVTRLLSELLARVPSFDSYDYDIEHALEFEVEVSDVHRPQLRAIMKGGDSLAAAAVMQLVRLEGAAVKPLLLEELYEKRGDYNYCCNGIARALKPHVDPADLTKLFELTERLSAEMTPDADEDEAVGFVAGCAVLLSCFDLDVVRASFLQKPGPAPIPEARARVLCDMLQDYHSTAALNMAGELLLAGVDRAALSLYFISRFKQQTNELSWTSFHRIHVDRLLALALSANDRTWATRALRELCEARADLAEYVNAYARTSQGLHKVALQYCSSQTDQSVVFESLAKLAKLSSEQRRTEPLHLLRYIELVWTDHEGLLVELLKLRDTNVAMPLIESLYVSYKGEGLRGIELGPIDWWIDWLAEKDPSKLEDYFFLDRISDFISMCLSVDVKRSFIASFNHAEPRVKSVLASSVLLKMADLTSDDLSEGSLAFLIGELKETRVQHSEDRLLAKIATEKFVVERLLPLLDPEPGHLQDNLRNVIRQAGQRHGRRYLGG